MWIFTNKGMVSAVAHREKRGYLLVRAREKDHLTAFFGESAENHIKHTPRADYAWRIEVSRPDFEAAAARQIDEIDYDNFKNSVLSQRLHAAYSRVWSIMLGLQTHSRTGTTRNSLPG